ncbi:helix-turn-helix domain-containing protein [Dactylosporangium salmoneum]|uniref:TetR/AcrR family transcriptional regulator n=1 Tax=Dactylosporangium salmoneum TaxID=53361 RepID=A0ABP5V5U0_9ACTN
MDGLRERKKARTRQALSDAATRLFAERGFEAVTVAEIAAAADVGVGTVFNYFRAKEDLFFDRADAIEAGLVDAVATRPPGRSVTAAFRRWHEAELDFMLDPRAEEPIRRYFTAIAASHSLQTAEHALFCRLQSALAGAARVPTPSPPADPMPDILAALLMALHRAVLDAVRDAPATARRTSRLAFAALSPAAEAWGGTR